MTNVRPVPLALAVWLLAGPALALPEGRFVSADGSAMVEVAARPEGGADVDIVLPGLEQPLALRLVTTPGGAVLQEPAAPLGWFDRLMGRKPDRLPFEGHRLGWAVTEGDALVVNTLEVDGRGLPDLRRYEMSPDGAGGLTLTPWRYAGTEPMAGAAVSLERAQP